MNSFQRDAFYCFNAPQIVTMSSQKRKIGNFVYKILHCFKILFLSQNLSMIKVVATLDFFILKVSLFEGEEVPVCLLAHPNQLCVHASIIIAAGEGSIITSSWV